MSNLKFLCFLLFSFLVFSCSKNVIIVQLTNSAKKTQDKNNAFENDSVLVKYNFWFENGGVNFTLTNKLNKPLYIDLKKCTYFINGQGYPYWKDEEIVNNVGSVVSKQVSSNNNKSQISVGLISSTGIVTHPERIMFIAPASSITLKLSPTQEYRTFVEDSVLKSNKRGSFTLDLNGLNTLLRFRNFITVSGNEKFENETYINNELWADKILVITENEFDETNDKADKVSCIAPNRYYLKFYFGDDISKK